MSLDERKVKFHVASNVLVSFAAFRLGGGQKHVYYFQRELFFGAGGGGDSRVNGLNKMKTCKY